MASQGRPESWPLSEVEQGKAACLDKAGSADTLAWDQTSRGVRTSSASVVSGPRDCGHLVQEPPEASEAL